MLEPIVPGFWAALWPRELLAFHDVHAARELLQITFRHCHLQIKRQIRHIQVDKLSSQNWVWRRSEAADGIERAEKVTISLKFLPLSNTGDDERAWQSLRRHKTRRPRRREIFVKLNSSLLVRSLLQNCSSIWSQSRVLDSGLESLLSIG